MPTQVTETFDFDEVVDHIGLYGTKWEYYQSRDILPLWVADMDFRSPPAVIEAVQQRAASGVLGYCIPPAELTPTIIDCLERSYGWHVEPDWILWHAGMVSALNTCCRAVGEIGDAAMIATPIYPPFFSAPAHVGRETLTTPLRQHGDAWQFDFDHLDSAITPRTRLFMLCNPHNPVGRIFTRDELSQLAELCLRHDLVICSDEIHCQLILDQDKHHIPIASLSPEIANRSITLMAPSKTYNLAGLYCSFAIIPNPQLRTRFERARAGIVPKVNALGYAASLAAYRDGDAWLAQLLDYLRTNRDLLAAAVCALPGIDMTPVAATYLAWLDVRPLQLTDPKSFFEQAGLGFNDGTEFGAPGFVRFNFGCTKATLAEAIRRLQQAIPH